MILRKLLDLLTRSSKTEQPDPLNEPSPAPLINSTMFRKEKDPDEATRPIYRVGKHKSSDLNKIIDLSG